MATSPERSSPGRKPSKPRGSGSKPRSSDSQPRASDSKPRGSGSKPRTSDSQPRAADSKQRGSGSKPRSSERRPPASRSQEIRSRERPGAAGPYPDAPVDVHVEGGVRLQKVLASAGLGSRRACEELIAAGRVSVDGTVVRELGVRVDPSRSAVHVDGLRVQLDPTLVTLALHKPVGVVSTMHDPQGRPSLAQYVADRPERVFHVGRLDAETSGLLLLTNDGELGHRLSHPSFEVPKTYVATVEGRVERGLGRRLREGVELEDGLVRVDSFAVLDSAPASSIVQVVLHEGRNHVVRRLLAEVGHPVTALARTQVGPVRLGSLRSGRTRVIEGAELGSLMAAVGL